MKKILLVLEDYNELLFVETLLKKVGFDCLGLQSEQKIADSLLSFNPHLLISEGYGRKISGFQIAQKLKKNKNHPKQMIIVGAGDKVDPAEMDQWEISGKLTRPVHPVELSEVLGRVLGLDPNLLKEKFQKLGLFQDKKSDDKLKIVSGRVPPAKQLVHLKESPLNDDDRSLRGRKAIEDLPQPEVDGIDNKQVSQQIKEFRSREDDPEIKEIDAERFSFTKQLFKRT